MLLCVYVLMVKFRMDVGLNEQHFLQKQRDIQRKNFPVTGNEIIAPFTHKH